MHSHLELIMPPIDDYNLLEERIEEILRPFCSRSSEKTENRSSFTFWDSWRIGGRFSQQKILARVPQYKLDAFYKEIERQKITCSGIVCGKPELSPSNQIPLVNALWREFCPEGGDVCPLFKHSGEGISNTDICQIKNLPRELEAHAVIIASYNHNNNSFGVADMIHSHMWNGVSFVKTYWDTKVFTFITWTAKEYSRLLIQDDWLAITIDYHN